MNREDYTEEVWDTAISVVNNLRVSYPNDVGIKREFLNTIRSTISDVRNTDIISFDRYADYINENIDWEYVHLYWEIITSVREFRLWDTAYETEWSHIEELMPMMQRMVNDFYSDVMVEAARLVWDDIKEEEE